MLKRYMFFPAIWAFVIFFWALPALAEMIVDTAWVRRIPVSPYQYHAPSLSLDAHKNVYVTGCSGSVYNSDFMTVKYYPNGDTAWVRTYNGPENSYDWAYAMAVDDFGNVYVTGISSGSGTSQDYATIKYYPNGNTAWVRRYNGQGNSDDGAIAIAVDGSNNVYVTGQSYDSGTDWDFATIKYYPNGDTAWIRIYNGPGNSIDCAPAIAVDVSGNVYVSGYSGNKFVAIRYYPDGDTAWIRRYEEPPANCEFDGVHMSIDHSGNVYLTGTSYNGYATLKYYPSGDIAWVRIYTGPSVESWDRVRSIAVDDSGCVFVTGYSIGDSSGGYSDYATIKYYPNGDTAWVRRYDGPGNSWDEARSLELDLSGNVYVTGYSDDGNYSTIKYYPNGDTAWVRRYISQGSMYQDSAMAIDASGNVYVSGWCDYNWITIKYFQSPRGDANRDGIIDVTDIIYLINFLFREGPAPNPFTLGDAGCNGYITVGDITYLINYLFKSGPVPTC